MNDSRKKVVTAAGQVLEGFLGGSVFARSSSLRVAVGVVREARRRKRMLMAVGVSRAAAVRCESFSGEHV